MVKEVRGAHPSPGVVPGVPPGTMEAWRECEAAAIVLAKLTRCECQGGVVRRDAGRLHPGRACSPDSALKAQLLASPATTGWGILLKHALHCAWRGNTRSESTRSRPSAYFIDGIDALSYCRLAIRHAKGSPDRQCGRGRAGPAIVVVGSAPLRWMAVLWLSLGILLTALYFVSRLRGP